MTPARKNALFNFVLRRALSWTLRRRFHNIYVAGRQHLRDLAPNGPVVGCVNHSNWWDGFVLYVLSHRLLPHDIYLAMEEKNLRRYPFFTWMGVFGLDLTAPAGAMPGLRYAIRLLREKRDERHPPLVWMFVQGGLLPAGHTPLEVKGGARLLARRGAAQILPLVLRYEWLRESRPSIFVHIGAPLPADTTTAALSEALNGLFAAVPTAVEAPAFAGYEPLYGAQMSMNRWWDYLVHRLHGTGRKFEADNR